MATSFRDFEQLDTLLNKPDECPLPNGGQPAAAAQGPGSIPAVIDDAVIPKPKAGARRVTVDSLYDRVTYSYSGSLHSVRQKHLGRGGPGRRGRPADRRQRYPASSGIRHTVQARGFGECTLHRPPRNMFTDLDVCECVAAHQDCFLGLDWEKDPSSACCNEIVVKVQLCWCFFVGR